MPKRSKVISLPEKVRAELDKKLIKKGFGGYTELASWLAEQGFEISRSSLHRYGREFEDKLAAIKIATEQARAITEAAEDREGSMNEALIRLIQQKSFDVLVGVQGQKGKENLPKMGIMIARLASAAVKQKKWMEEARRQALNEAAEKIGKTAKREGVSEGTIQKIRRDILGMAEG